MTKKSSIKDVCALLDMKSSKLINGITWYKLIFFLFTLDIEDVNKAFREMHEEVEQKVYRSDYETSLQSQQ